ncbi:MAG TPA: PAS domain-containing protein, partial [Stellaceae bacterium]|nr:PAS domain-containing protein [Stellaceae bacterium]
MRSRIARGARVSRSRRATTSWSAASAGSELTEQPLDGTSELVGYVRDFTDLESKEAELARHVAAHAEVLENVAVAIAIYGTDTRLKFFNSAFAKLWRLEEEWLATEPSIAEILDRIRERRGLP